MRNLIRALIAAFTLIAVPVVSQAGLFVGVSVGIPPPALPVYVQPPCPAPGYIWMPGYWAWDDGYYWVPGTWVLAPAVGVLWTPGYWGWAEGAYVWNAGYWGPHVGFYGGIDYGFGYGGVGYQGGYWRGNQFYYNRSVTNVSNNTEIHNVYNKTVVNNTTINNVSYNGGPGGASARPTERRKKLRTLADEPRTLALYEAPHRLLDTLEDALDLLGNRPGVIAREVTKMYEEFTRGHLEDLLAAVRAKPPRGEITLLVKYLDKQTGAADVIPDQTAKARLPEKAGG